MPEREKVAVIGGLGRMAKPTIEVFRKAGYPDILISDIKDPQTLPAREAIRQAGIVFFSVLPIETIGDIIGATSDVFRSDHLVLDNATLKNPLRESYERLDKRQVSICSTHPLCKDDQPFFGQNVFIAPFGQKPEAATLVAEQVYGKAGMVLIRVNFNLHDSLSLVNQLLPHVVNRAVGIVLAQNSIDMKAIDVIATANFRLSELAWWRTLVQNPQISATIIENLLAQPEGPKILRDLQDAVARIIREGGESGKLETTFADTVNLLDPTGEIRVVMNNQTITILERLANLKLHSVTIEVENDRPGLLRYMLGLLEKAGINLNAIDSRKTPDGIRFDLGIESGTMTPEAIKELEKSGFHVVSLTAS